MKLISSLIASWLAFTYAQNDTTTTEYPMAASTTMYTTEVIVFEPVVPQGDDPTKNLASCDYEWMGTLTDEDIEITICGYTVEEAVEDGEEDETEEVQYVAISLNIPALRWVALGFKTGDLSSDGGFINYAGYNIIIPIKSSDIQEIYYDTDKSRTDLDDSMIEIYSDTITSSLRRKTRLVRAKTVGYEHLNNTAENLQNQFDGLYFDFADFDTCGDSIVISVQYGSMDNSRFVHSGYSSVTSNTYGSREAVTADLDEADGSECSTGGEESIDGVSSIMTFGAVIIGFISILLF